MLGIFGKKEKEEELDGGARPLGMAGGIPRAALPEEQRENLESDLSLLGGESGAQEEKLQEDAVKEARDAAEDSVRKLHKINLGRCPSCGEHLSHHMTANICEACGWCQYDSPRKGDAVVHLTNGDTVVGERVYVLNGGDCLVMRGEAVAARVPKHSCLWVEYRWPEAELVSRRKQMENLLAEQLSIRCGWCGDTCDMGKEGFHLVHVAFGTTQERYCFCSDDCFEAFRKMYPARVHRDCYERNCNDCDLCTKRYSDEVEGMRVLAKDRLAMQMDGKPHD